MYDQFQYKDAILLVQESPLKKDKTVSWLYYLYNGVSIPGKIVFILKQGPGPQASML